MPKARVVDCCNFMPERVVRNDDLAAKAAEVGADFESNAFFHGVRERRFASPEYSSGRMATLAARKLLERNSVDPKSIDCIITACVLTDLLANGIGADVQRGLGADRANFVNVDTNCTSWVASLEIAKAFVESDVYKRVLIVTATNFVSRLPEYQRLKRSWSLGDGATATLIEEASVASILAIKQHSIGEYYGHMRLEPDASGDGCYRSYWERDIGPMTVSFSAELLEKIRENATANIPKIVHEVLNIAGLSTSDVNMLITHQPNRLFIDGWRNALGIHPPRAHDTLEIYGNLFMGSIPVTLADAVEKNLIKHGDLIVAATFANAGDHVSATVLRW